MHIRARSLWIFFISYFALTAGCQHTAPEATFGIQANHVSYTPARTLVLNCRPWPTAGLYAGQPTSNFSPDDIQALCRKFDEFILRGFEGQPFMRGLSPKAVEKGLAAAQKPQHVDEINHQWRHLGTPCVPCNNPVSFYNTAIAPRGDWLLWLNTLSRSVRNADAVLLPLITFGSHLQFNDRGVIVNQRRAGVVMYLIDTERGSIIWAGGREAEVSHKALVGATETTPPALPSLDRLMERLFIDDMWKDFPGRQQF